MQGDMDIVDPMIEEYMARLVGSPDPVEADMRRYADELGGYPTISPATGQLLSQYALLVEAQRIFELGSGFGYSAFWFARALSAGGSVTLTDHDDDHLERARDNLGRAGLVDRCRFEPAGDALEALARADGRLDIVFIDVEKREYPRALALALPKLRTGGLVLAQGVLWGGSVARGQSDESSLALREFLRVIHGSDGLCSTVLPIADGLSVTMKR
jgi:predicted O-methyltransferase YrrM